MSYFNCTSHMFAKLREILDHKLSYYVFDSYLPGKLVNVSDKEDVISIKQPPPFIPNDEYGKRLYFNHKLSTSCGEDRMIMSQHRSFIRKLSWDEVQNLPSVEKEKLKTDNVYEEIMMVNNSLLVIYFTF